MNLKTGNIFAALDSKSSKSSSGTKDSKKKKSTQGPAQEKGPTSAELEKAIFGQPNLGISNWADDDDDDEDEGHAPPQDDGWSRVPASNRALYSVPSLQSAWCLKSVACRARQ